MKFTKKLKLLFDEYLNTLDDNEKDEWYTTERYLTDMVFEKFLEWLETQKR